MSASIEQLVATREVLIACGSGGVGKTTTAAAIAASAAARENLRVLVLTIDPARRLGDALGLSGIGNDEVQVDPAAFEAAGVTPRGQLWAAMLDTKASWDDLIRQHAPDVATRDAILVNPLYRNITARFVQSHDYVAMERLYEIHSSGRYDLIVVDTPPTRNAIDFLEAPARMAEFFGSRLLRWLTAPARSRLVGAASKPFATVADRLLGATFVQDIAEFFLLFQSMERGFVERAHAVTRTLEDRRTAFVVVTTLDLAPAREAEFFIDALAQRHFNLGAVVCNRVLPDELRSRDGRVAAERMEANAEEFAAALARSMRLGADDLGVLATTLREVAESFLDYRVVASREAEVAALLRVVADDLVRVPALERDVTSLAELLVLGDHLW
jgi:anion-transporting  ArsA/GET3 family ATPase